MGTSNYNNDEDRFRRAPFVPVELQRRGFERHAIFSELATRAFESVPGGVRQVQPWCRWQGLSQYLDCIAFADRASRDLPTGPALNLSHVTPGRFFSVGTIFFTQALFDNVAVWLCDATSLSVGGGDRHFLSRPFQNELVRKYSSAQTELTKHEHFVKEVNKYRQVWVHTISGGAIPIADDNPFENPETARKFLGVPFDPAIQPDQENYMERAQRCAAQNNGNYLHHLGDFTKRVFESTTDFYLGWLRFALDNVR